MKFYETKEGKLASYVSHNLNNATSLIRANISYFLHDYPNADEPTRKLLDLILTQNKKVQDMSDYLYKKIKEEYELNK